MVVRLRIQPASELSSFLLFLLTYGLQDIYGIADRALENVDQAGQRGLHAANQFGQQFFSGRQFCQSLYFVNADYGAVQNAGFQFQSFMILAEIVEDFSRSNSVFRGEGQSGIVFQISIQAFNTSFLRSNTYKRILGNHVFNTGFTHFASQFGIFSYGQAAVVNQNHTFRTSQ